MKMALKNFVLTSCLSVALTYTAPYPVRSASDYPSFLSEFSQLTTYQEQVTYINTTPDSVLVAVVENASFEQDILNPILTQAQAPSHDYLETYILVIDAFLLKAIKNSASQQNIDTINNVRQSALTP